MAAAGTLTFGRFLGRSLGASRGLPVAHRCFGVKISPSGEKITHTGQVNENFAVDLIAEQPVTKVESRVISCDGGGGALGHPKVYINLDKETKTGTCGYCGLQFEQHHHH
ncbi:NADH dehydrogenase [ubiquinone] iron-sulfur protein 6, mitochondrial isoform X2 [Vombatus ursinus]|uniref:NADH dehydrogenase [ubiquinone] iron-sulfur protein 6, mitochondrial isoform X2 n=1 Tax=Vombatus ursinus TaxID=29139 RepID=UPI000FFD7998|nr:NADH dehydrogenase [ubiquinone] iron-sulfur protein 6, mitochondrial isoform X2 [Vombatus ursinus]